MKTRKGEKRGNVKNFFKKGVIWSLVISLLFGTTAMAASTTVLVDGWAAEGGYNYIGETGNAATRISEAAEMYAVAHAIYRCLDNIKNQGHEYIHNAHNTLRIIKKKEREKIIDKNDMNNN